MMDSPPRRFRVVDRRYWRWLAAGLLALLGLTLFLLVADPPPRGFEPPVLIVFGILFLLALGLASLARTTVIDGVRREIRGGRDAPRPWEAHAAVRLSIGTVGTGKHRRPVWLVELIGTGGERRALTTRWHPLSAWRVARTVARLMGLPLRVDVSGGVLELPSGGVGALWEAPRRRPSEPSSVKTREESGLVELEWASYAVLPNEAAFGIGLLFIVVGLALPYFFGLAAAVPAACGVLFLLIPVLKTERDGRQRLRLGPDGIEHTWYLPFRWTTRIPRANLELVYPHSIRMHAVCVLGGRQCVLLGCSGDQLAWVHFKIVECLSQAAP